MARYFAGNTLAAFARSSLSTVEVTTAGRFDSTYVPNAISIIPGTYIETPIFDAAATTLWMHFEWYNTTTFAGTAGDRWMEFFNSSGVMVARFYFPSSSATVRFEYWDGAAFVNGGTYVLTPTNTRLQYDIKITCGASGGVELYVGSTLAATFTLADADTNDIKKVRIYAIGSQSSFISQCMMADFDTRDCKYMISAINGLSAVNTAGTGAYTTVNETPTNDSDGFLIDPTTAKRGVTHSAISVPGGYNIGAAVVNGRARIGGTITNGKLGIRSSGTNYSGSNRNYSSALGPGVRIEEQDPATTAAWTESGFNAAESYAEAI